jgi:ABC-type Mn2+/Zn2+ transport system ATPase subunit
MSNTEKTTDIAPVVFENVTFFYPVMPPESDDQSIQALSPAQEITQVFGGVSATFPEGVMSLVGENGTGKSTALLLAGARIFPNQGTVRIYGRDTGEFKHAGYDPELERERNRLVSFVYQNMEFETEESIGQIMEYVYENGFHERKDPSFLRLLERELELGDFLGKQTHKLAKGQLQRAIIAFSLLYGSKIIMMDEPVFAVEEDRKDRIFGFLYEYASQAGWSIYYSAHNLELTQKYSDYMMLFDKGGNLQIGPTAELYTEDNIEQAFQYPYGLLHRKEYLFREMLMTEDAHFGHTSQADTE